MANPIARLFRRNGRWERVAAARATAVLGQTPGEVYRTQPALRAVVGFLSRNGGALPLKVYERRGENDRPRDTESPLALLLQRPNADTTTYELVRGTFADLMLYGWSLWYTVPDADTLSGWSITRIPPEWMREPYTTDGFTPSAFEVQVPALATAPTRIEAADCVRFALYDPSDPVSPASPVEALKQVLAEQISAYDYRNKVWRNGGQVNRWISRGEGVEWSPEARKRFATDWKERFSGQDGTDTGGTPILEDGMMLHDSTFNAKDAQWAESTRLSREDVAAVYGVNPSLIWHTDAQTYASAKDNARALYSETLAPYLDLVEERINKVLVPRLGMDAGSVYAEFDVQSKVKASPEELLPTLVQATGRPVLLTDEARAMLNRPAIGGDAAELVTPLNLMVGGQLNGEASAEPRAKASEPQAKGGGPAFKSRRQPDAEGSAKVTGIIAKFAERQSRRVLSEIDKAKAAGTLVKAVGTGRFASWWDAKRWNRELADDLEPAFADMVSSSARGTLSDISLDPDGYEPEYAEAYVRAMAERNARAFNDVTYRQLKRAVGIDPDEADPDVQGDSPEGVFEKARQSRAARAAVAMATGCAVFGMREAVRQRVDGKRYRTMKTWVHAGSGEASPRDEHLAMDGETVGMDEKFSNGAMWPHDDTFTADESCNCQCQVEIGVYRL